MITIKEYRGHIRNWESLCAELQIDASLTREKREKEILIKAYEVWGHDMADHLYGMFAFALWDDEKEELFAPDNIAKAKMIEPLEDVINKLYHEIKKRHMYRLLHGQCTEAAGLILIDIIRNYERIADHCTKIAITLIELESDDYKTHEYREQSEKERSVQFQDEYKQLSQTYTLS